MAKVTKHTPQPVPPPTYDLTDLTEAEAHFLRDLLGRVTVSSNVCYQLFVNLNIALGEPSAKNKFHEVGGREARDINTIRAVKR